MVITPFLLLPFWFTRAFGFPFRGPPGTIRVVEAPVGGMAVCLMDVTPLLRFGLLFAFSFGRGGLPLRVDGWWRPCGLPLRPLFVHPLSLSLRAPCVSPFAFCKVCCVVIRFGSDCNYWLRSRDFHCNLVTEGLLCLLLFFELSTFVLEDCFLTEDLGFDG